MNIYRLQVSRIMLLPLLVAWGAGLFRSPVKAQGPELQERVAELKESMAKNKQSLGQYTWVEQVNISLKGELKKQEHFQVRLGPDGKSQKTSLDPPAEPPSGGRLKKRIVEKKKEEYKEYAEQMKALAQQYVPPDKEMIQQAYAQGNISIIPGGGLPADEIKLVFHNYVKPQDSMTMVYDKAQKQLLSLEIASYMDDPKDAMTLTVAFSRLPDGTNHVSTVTMNGVSKQLNIATQNASYQHL
jgi:hypothetical protein